MKLEAMVWMVFLTLVALSFLFPKARLLSFSALGLAIVALMSIVVVAGRREPSQPTVKEGSAVPQKSVDFERLLVDKLDKADPEASTRIPLDKIRFGQLHSEAGAEAGSIGTVVARLYNDSLTDTLTDYGYDLMVQDCIKTVCTTVFEQRGMSAVSVPPNQARDVRIVIRDGGPRDTPPIKIFGTANIVITPAATRAQPASKVSAE